MTDQDNISILILMRLQPGAELVSGHLDGLVGLVPGVDLGMDSMRFAQLFPQKVVDVCGERAEGRVVAHEAVDVNNE